MTGATRKRDLRTGRSVWADSNGLGVPTRPLTQAISVDVAIVGAGISGAFMAHALSKDHLVAVLDRRPPLSGSTLASTALLQWEIDLPLTTLSERIGLAKARRAYLRSYRAVEDLRRIVAEERIVCGLRPKSSLYLAGDAYGSRALEAEADARSEIGLDSRYLARPSFATASASIERARSFLLGRRPAIRPAWRRASCGAPTPSAPEYGPRWR